MSLPQGFKAELVQVLAPDRGPVRGEQDLAALRVPPDDDPLDGVYVFGAISVGLSSGTGNLGVGYVMTCFFCLGATIMWSTRYGKRPKAEAPPAVAAEEGAVVSGEAAQPPRQAS